MKTIIKTVLAALLVVAISCTKESINKNSSPLSQATIKPALSFTIGQHYGGGIIFYIDNTGMHGLIADTGDLATVVTWYNGSFIPTGATGTLIGTGKSNTRKIVLAQGKSGSYAALKCSKSKRSGYSDWFLPSRDELNAMYLQKDLVGRFALNFYWSSSEGDGYSAWGRYFTNGYETSYFKNSTYYVRAVRSF